MSLAKKSDKMSEQEYLEAEKMSEVKHEYIAGYVYAMAGASKNHSLIIKNVLYGLENILRQIKSPCKIFSSDMKIKENVTRTQYFYPDVVVVCDTSHDDSEYYTNSPVIIVEVLSSSTRIKDKTSKKLAYFNIPTLQEYVLIEQDCCEITVFRKNEDWRPMFYFLGDFITFESIDVTLSVEDIYYQVDNKEIVHFLKTNEKQK